MWDVKSALSLSVAQTADKPDQVSVAKKATRLCRQADGIGQMSSPGMQVSGFVFGTLLSNKLS